VLGLEPKASHMVGKFTIKLHLQPLP
jgi:hypothetical protein